MERKKQGVNWQMHRLPTNRSYGTKKLFSFFYTYQGSDGTQKTSIGFYSNRSVGTSGW
jgi:hypothetical protein